MAGGFSVTQVLNTAVKLEIADRLARGSRSATDLAAQLGVEERTLQRFLRIMVALGLLAQDESGAFTLTPLGAPLAADHADSIRDRIRWIGEVSYPVAQAMLHSVQTGRPAFEYVFGVPFFEYLAQHPDMRRIFNDLMAEEVAQRSAAIVAAYDFSSVTSVVDVGGGNGAMLAAILVANPHTRGIVFDLPDVVAEAREALNGSVASGRMEFAAGNVFSDALPPGAGIYMLSHVIHDWSDAQARRILANCRNAMGAQGRLLIVEELLPARVADAPATVGNDFNMLLLTGGFERSEGEYATMLDAAGLRISATIPFEATPVHGGRRSNWAILECRAKERA